MNDDELHDLLRQADQAAPPPPAAVSAAGVRRKTARRQLGRSAIAGTLAAVIVTAWFAYAPSFTQPAIQRVVQQPSQEAIRLAELTADDLISYRRRDAALAQARRADPLVQLHLDLGTIEAIDSQGDSK